MSLACKGGGDFSNGLTYKTTHALYACTLYTIFHGMVHSPDPVENIRNLDACRGPITYPKIKINPEYPLFRVLPSFPRFTLFRVLPSFPRFTLFSAFYPLFRVLPSFPRFTLFSAFYPLFRVLPSFPFPLFRFRHSGSAGPFRSVSAFYPYPTFTWLCQYISGYAILGFH